MQFKDDGQYVVTQDGVKIYFEADGIATNPPLFIIAGVGASEETFNHVAERLKNDYYVIKHDGRGIGLSDRPSTDLTIQMLVEDVIAVADHLKLDKINILGHSLGGIIAQQFYNQYPERVKCLILASTLVGYSDPKCVNVTQEVMGLLTTKTAFPEDPEFEQKMLDAAWLYFDESFVKTPAGREAVIEQLKINKARSDTNGIVKRGVPGWTFANSANLKNITVPVLVIQGTNDYLVPAGNADIFTQSIPNCQKVMFENCGHHPFVEKLDLFVKTVAAFLHKNA
jgi:proline-specific peptidase